MDDFANKVITTAAGGDSRAVAKLAASDAVNTSLQADALVTFAKDWNPGSDTLSIPREFGSMTRVTAKRNSGNTTTYQIAWLNDRWVLVIGKRTSGGSGSPTAKP